MGVCILDLFCAALTYTQGVENEDEDDLVLMDPLNLGVIQEIAEFYGLTKALERSLVS